MSAPQTILVVGPPNSGKSLFIARLAAQHAVARVIRSNDARGLSSRIASSRIFNPAKTAPVGRCVVFDDWDNEPLHYFLGMHGGIVFDTLIFGQRTPAGSRTAPSSIASFADKIFVVQRNADQTFTATCVKARISEALAPPQSFKVKSIASESAPNVAAFVPIEEPK